MLPKLKQFLVVIAGLIVAKLWHDTLPIFLDLYPSEQLSRSLLSNYISCNSLGMTLGGAMAGMFTDSLSPRIVFPNAMAGIVLTTICIILGFQAPAMKSFFADFIVSIGFYYILILLFQKRYRVLPFFIAICFFFDYSCLKFPISPSLLLVSFAYSLCNYLVFCLLAFRFASKLTSNTFLKLILIFNTFSFLSSVSLLSSTVSSIFFKNPSYKIATFSSLINFEKQLINLVKKALDPNLIFFLIRGAFISASMNSAYVTVGDIYRGSSWLPIASAYLYTALFGCLASLPIIIKYTSKEVFLLLGLVNLSLPFVLSKVIPKKDVVEVNLRNYLSSILVLAKSKEFWLVCSVTMVCIGSFYNLMYAFRDASMNGDLTESLVKIQSFGRYSTFIVGLISTFSGIAFFRISNKNCAQFMYFGMATVSLGMMCLGFFFMSKNLGMLAQSVFYIICACSGVCQPAAKASILSVAQNLGPRISGTAQSLTNFSYSFIEFIGSNIIFRLNYPIGSIIYLFSGGILVMLVSILIYRSRKKINSYISSDP